MMTKNEVKNAIREAVSYEFREISHDEVQYTFSPEFEKKMQKMIKKEKKLSWHFVNTASKRLAVVVAVFIILVTSISRVEAVRESIKGFLVEVSKVIFTEKLVFEGTDDVIKVEYEMTLIPEGFTKIYYHKNMPIVGMICENEAGDTIVFSQSVTDGNILLANNDVNSITEIIKISGKEIYFFELKNDLIVRWMENGYEFSLMLNPDFDKESIIEMIQGVKIVEEKE